MKINWGILSTAHINRRIIPAIRHSGRGQLRAVASRDLFKAEAYALHWDIPISYGSYEELLADKDIHIIYNSLPNHLHAHWTIKALEAGKQVLCEKPMCLTLAEMDAIEEASLRTGNFVMEGYMHLHHPQTHLWKSIVDSGVLGEIHSLRSCFTFNLERPTDNYRWNADAGGGALWDVGVYPISLFQYLLGESPISGMATFHLQDGVDHSTSAQLDYTQGRTAQFFVSFRSSFSTDIIIHGSAGQLQISHPLTNADACQAYIRSGNKIEHLDVPRQYLYSGEVEAMHDYLTSGKKPLVTTAFSRKILETILMLKNNL
ncbi:MAG: Gfo/Idh/MocA family oxidoreductase [Saprospiraceae bacterium]|nr:Gfo/Idh/MocA family oxidoreductase [Candidatus Opimibacter iunctus]